MKKQVSARDAFHVSPRVTKLKRCGTCGEKKPVYQFTDGECDNCHFAPSAFAEEVTSSDQEMKCSK